MVYRDGGSDGSFAAIVDTEVCAIRRAFCEIATQDDQTFVCPNANVCNGSGCQFCTPPITFIVAQNDHNIRIVPTPNNGPGKPSNVPSGTIVDSRITSYSHFKLPEARNQANQQVASDGKSLHLFETKPDQGMDFLLTAHGGLKGTSKPVYYRVLLNENAVRPPAACGTNVSPLSDASIQKMTYHMAFQCELSCISIFV